MKVFFSGSIRGGRDMLPAYNYICNFLHNQGFEIMSWHVVDTKLEKTESGMKEQEIFERDIGLIEESDILLADVTVPSIGVGYELCHAIHKGIPVICMHKKGANLSSMVLGNIYDKIIIVEYSDFSELETIIIDSIDSISPQ